MEELILVKPSMEYEKELNEYKNSFVSRNEYVQGGAGIENFKTIGEWIKYLEKLENIETCPKNLVTSSEYMLLRKGERKVLGLINFRHSLNDFLEKFGGHIGYSVIHDERGKKYGTKQLLLCLEKTRDKGLEKVLITCDKDNLASKSTIESVGGIFENELTDNNGIIKLRYWINL